MKPTMAVKLIGLLLYWGTIIAAGCLYGFGAAMLVVVGAVFAGVVLGAEDATGDDAPDGQAKADSCTGCKHDLGGGACRINLEAECGKGEHEMWEDTMDDD